MEIHEYKIEACKIYEKRTRDTAANALGIRHGFELEGVLKPGHTVRSRR